MQFFNIDLHISVIADLRYIFESMGHTVTDWSISGHAWVFGREVANIEVVTQSTWHQIDRAMCDAFYSRYKDEFKKYDAFIVTHTPCFAMLYERWEKPIIVVAATRYEYPFSADRIKWEQFNEFLRRKIDSNQIIPIANNKYDAAYAELFTNRKWQVIPSLCDYTNAPYQGIREDFLYFSLFKRADLRANIKDKDVVLKPGYRWCDLAAYRGVIHVPYNASTMSIFEQYTSNIPLFIPSISFISKLHKEYYTEGVLSQLSFNQVAGLSPGSAIPVSGLDPNNYSDTDAIMEWMRLADYYDNNNMPYIIYFESFDHLKAIIGDVDVIGVSESMRNHNLRRKKQITESWQAILRELRVF
jgi:hypothetical protein